MSSSFTRLYSVVDGVFDVILNKCVHMWTSGGKWGSEFTIRVTSMAASARRVDMVGCLARHTIECLFKGSPQTVSIMSIKHSHDMVGIKQWRIAADDRSSIWNILRYHRTALLNKILYYPATNLQWTIFLTNDNFWSLITYTMAHTLINYWCRLPFRNTL